MVAVRSMVQQQMQVHQRVAGNGCPEFLHKLSIELADLFCWEVDFIHKRHATTEIDCRRDKRFFHRQGHVTIAADAFLVAERLIEAAAETDADIFNGVMVIDMKVANSLHCQIEQAVPREEGQHVVEEANSRGDFVLAAAVEIQRQLNLSFSGVASDRSGTGHRRRRNKSAQTKKSAG